MCLAFYRPPPPPVHEGHSAWDLFIHLDFVGIALFSGGLGVFLMGVIWAGGESRFLNFVSVKPLTYQASMPLVIPM